MALLVLLYLPSLISLNRTSLVAQWIRIRLPMQATQIWSRSGKIPHATTKPKCQDDRACALEPASHNYHTNVLQLLSPLCLEPVVCNKRSRWRKNPLHHTRSSPCSPQLEKAHRPRMTVKQTIKNKRHRINQKWTKEYVSSDFQFRYKFNFSSVHIHSMSK